MMMITNREEACTLARILNSATDRRNKFVVVRRGKVFEVEEVKLPRVKPSILNQKRDGNKTFKQKQLISRSIAEKKKVYQKIVQEYFGEVDVTYKVLSEKYDISIKTVARVCAEYRDNGFKFHKGKFEEKHLTAWNDNKEFIEIVLRERSKGKMKAEIMKEFDLSDRKYKYASGRISIGTFLDIEEYQEMVEKYGYKK